MSLSSTESRISKVPRVIEEYLRYFVKLIEHLPLLSRTRAPIQRLEGLEEPR
jgi:hypothetical protein